MASNSPENICVRRIRILIEGQDKRALDGQSKICSHLANRLKEKADNARKEFIQTQSQDAAKLIYTKYGLRNLIPGLKEEYRFYRSVYSSPLKNVGLRLSRAITHYQESQKGIRQGPKIAWPRFHKWSHDWYSLEYDEPNKGYKCLGKTLHLSLGKDKNNKQLGLKLSLAEFSPDKKLIRALRIVKEGGEYYAVFTIQYRPIECKSIKRIAAIDPNHKNFGYLVDNHRSAAEIQNLDNLRQIDTQIDKLKRHRDKCQRKSQRIELTRQNGTVSHYWKCSRQWRRRQEAVQRAEKKRREQTKHFLFSLANRLCEKYDLIALGDYAPPQGDSGLGRKANRQIKNRSLLGRFKPILSWVGKRSGKEVEIFDETGTTRTCSHCDRVIEGGISPSIRIWKCPKCGHVHLRDENAAKNGLLRLKRKRNLRLPRSGPVLVKTRCDWRFHPQGWWEMPYGGANVNENQCVDFSMPTSHAAVGVIALDPGFNQV